MPPWEQWKRGFTAWESATAAFVEKVMASPVVLGPSGAGLGASMRAKAASEQGAAAFWAAWGLPTKRDQERLLYLVGRLESRLSDLEERLAELPGE